MSAVVKPNAVAFDAPLICAVVGLMAMGTIMVTSASVSIVADEPLYYLVRHLGALGLGVAGLVLVVSLPTELWYRLNWLLLIAGFGLLVIVLMPAFGQAVNGSRRWLQLGPITVQASEPARLCLLLVERAHRRVTVQYAKRVVGRRQYGGSSTHIPLKVNTGGVIPVIFASSILSFFSMAAPLFEVGTWARAAMDQVAYAMPLYNLLYVVLIVFFAYFYTSIIFNPDDVAENMRKYGGFIPGIRPGKRTAEYIDTILARITLVGAVYLALVALLPDVLIYGFQVAPIPFIGESLDRLLPDWFTQGLNVPFYFGGTSLLIVVSVSMDTVNQVESQLIMRHYDGFMKKTRIRGRRG
jgi:hypothetical protein